MRISNTVLWRLSDTKIIVYIASLFRGVGHLKNESYICLEFII